MISTTPFRVSVVVIVLNGVKTIGECLDSLVLQTYPHEYYEILVVDNGSTDGTQKIVTQYPVKLIFQPIRGYAPARNAGVKAANGDVVAFTDADCVVELDWLEKLMKPFDDPRIGLTGGHIAAYPSREPTYVEKFIEEAKFIKEPKTIGKGIISHLTTANVAYRKKYISQANFFNEKLLSCEDVDISRTIQVELGLQAIYVPEAIIYHRNYRDIHGLFRFSRRNGYGEILMAAKWNKYHPFQTSIWHEIRVIIKQFLSLFVYIGSFLYRAIIVSSITRKDYAFRLKPLLWFIAEGATILGKIDGLVATHFIHRLP
jgi:glycosyltransferase involved in cell wall biosynthesis